MKILEELKSYCKHGMSTTAWKQAQFKERADALLETERIRGLHEQGMEEGVSHPGKPWPLSSSDLKESGLQSFAGKQVCLKGRLLDEDIGLERVWTVTGEWYDGVGGVYADYGYKESACYVYTIASEDKAVPHLQLRSKLPLTDSLSEEVRLVAKVCKEDGGYFYLAASALLPD